MGTDTEECREAGRKFEASERNYNGKKSEYDGALSEQYRVREDMNRAVAEFSRTEAELREAEGRLSEAREAYEFSRDQNVNDSAIEYKRREMENAGGERDRAQDAVRSAREAKQVAEERFATSEARVNGLQQEAEGRRVIMEQARDQKEAACGGW